MTEDGFWLACQQCNEVVRTSSWASYCCC